VEWAPLPAESLKGASPETDAQHCFPDLVKALMGATDLEGCGPSQPLKPLWALFCGKMQGEKWVCADVSAKASELASELLIRPCKAVCGMRKQDEPLFDQDGSILITKISKGSGTDFLATQLYSAGMLASGL
jgi:hypothetical protein